MPMITSCVTVSAAPRRPLSLSSVPMERPHGPGPGPGASPQSPGHHGRQGHAAGQHAVWQHPFPTPPGKRQQDATPPGTPNKDAKDSKKKWSLGALGLGGALSGSLSGSIGGLFRRRRKSDSSSSLEEEELATPPSARKTSNGISSNNFLRRRREASTNNNNNNSKRKTRTNARVSGAFDHVVVTPLAQPLSQPYSPTKVEHVNGYLIHPNSHFAPNLHMPGLAGSPIDSGQFGGSFPKALNLQQDRHRGWVSPSSPPQHLLQPPQLHGRHRRQDSKGSSVGSGVGSGQGSAGHSGASASGASGSLDGIIRRGKRDLAKQRAELRRQAAGGDSSSEGEGSLHSNSSSLSRFRSDDSLPSNKDSLSRRSRTARTERYLRRLSKDEEGMAQAGGQAVPKWPKTLSMSANSSPVTSPASRPRNAAHVQDPHLDPANIAGLPASQSLRGAAGVVRQQANGRSVSYDCNMDNSDVMVVQFPVARMQALPLAAAGAAPAGLSRGGSVSPSRFSAFARQQPQQEPLQHQQQLQQPLVQQQGEPPPPPPRDPQRRYMTASQLDVGRPMSYAFETGSRHSLTNNQQQYHPTEHSPQPQGYAPHHHHLHNEGSAFHSYQRHPEPVQAYLPQQYPQRYYHVREPQSSHVSPAATLQPAQQPTPQNYTYYAEQAPRSRKPIHIASPAEKPAAAPAVAAVAASGVALAAPMSPPSRRGRSRPLSPRPQANAAKYFPSNSYSPTRGQDRQDMPMSPPSRRMRPRLRSADSVSSLSSEVSSPQLPRAARTASTARTAPTATAAVSSAAVVTAPNGTQVRRDSDAPRGMLVKPIVQVQYKDAQKDESSSGLDDEEMMRIVDKERKSTNLDDALSELEAIYNSLRLGDEDLLDRAERRDLPRGPQYVTYQRTSSLEDDAELSVPTPTSPKLERERVGKVRGVPDKVADDMAYRRLRQAERPPSQQDSRSIVSQAGSYLLVSTALSAPQSPLSPRAATLSPEPEPDVTLDDVVYRNVRQANSTLRVAEHQPPFGIPLGPVAPSPNSDYLHATPQDRYRPRFKPRRTPDVVKDDLAFRSLRKDGQRDSAGLPPNPADAVPLHPAVATPPPSEAPTASRKKRAVRSLSANIFSLIQREVDMLDTPLHAPEPRPPGTEKQDFEKAQSVSDLAAVLQVAQKVQARKAAQLKQRTDGADNDATPRASSCYGDAAATSTETLTDSVLDLQPRPRPSPRGGLSGASSDREESSSPSKSMSVDSNLDSLLDEMAKEARETSAKLGREIEELGAAAPSGGRGRAPKARKRSTKAGSPTTADSPTAVKLSHEEKNRQLKEQVVALARCRSGCVDRDREAARSPTTDSDRAQDHARILELSETARTQMESLQQLTEMLSPKPSRRNVTEAPSATRTSASPSRRNVLGEASVARTSPSPTRRAVSPTDPPSSREPSAPQLSPSPSRRPASHSSREPSATKLSPSPARRTVVDSQSSREPSTSRLSPSPRPRRNLSSDGPSSVESGDGDDDLLPVSARVQMWNQRHHSKITSKPPPANKVFVRHADDASTARGSTTSSPQLSDAVDSVDGPTSSAANSLERPRAAASVETEVDDAVPWRRRRPSLPSPSLTPSLTSPPATPRTPTRPEAAPRAMRSPVHNAVAVVEPAVERTQAVQTAAAAGSSVSNAVDNTVDDAVVRSAGSAVASSVDIAADCPKAPSESSDSSDRDEDDKEVAALLSNTRIPSAAGTAAAPPAAAPTLATAAAPGLPLHRGAAPAAVRPAGEGLACRSRSTSPAPWYRTTESVLIACSYGLACAAKLADADFITALGILLACLTLVAFLLIS